MSGLKIFNFKDLQVRTVLVENEPWFVAKDVCDVLELSNSRMALERLDDDEKDVSSIDTLGGSQEMQIVNEYGLYSLVLGSRKPEAKEFKRWITHDVIPSIRKHGAYMTPATIEEAILNPDFGIRLLTSLKEEREARKVLELQTQNGHKKGAVDKMIPHFVTAPFFASRGAIHKKQYIKLTKTT